MSEIELKSNVIKTGQEKGIILRFILASLVGVFMFFVPVTINGASSIMIDHIVSWIRLRFRHSTLLCIICYGNWCDLSILYEEMECIYRRHLFFYFKSSWRCIWHIILFKSRTSLVLCARCWTVLYEKLVISVSLLVPIGSAFLALLVGYGLLEFIGTFCRPIMRPLWNTPGDRQSTQLRPSLEVIRLLSLLRIACIKKESIRQKKRRLSLQDFLQYPLHL